MIHQRKVIRDAVKDLLLGNTPAADKVFTNRPLPFEDASLPAIFIYALGEEVERSNVYDGELKRILNLSIEARIKATASLDDEMDAIALTVEQLMGAEDALVDIALTVNLASTEMEIGADGIKPIGAIRLNYEIKYLF